MTRKQGKYLDSTRARHLILDEKSHGVPKQFYGAVVTSVILRDFTNHKRNSECGGLYNIPIPFPTYICVCVCVIYA